MNSFIDPTCSKRVHPVQKKISITVGISLATKSYFKVAGVVNLRLAFTQWFFYNLVILIKLCKIRYLNLNKALLFPRNQVICLKNWKFWWAPTTIKFNISCWNFAHVSYLTMSTKVCSGFFLFCSDFFYFS